MRALIAPLLIGTLFGAGIALSGMIDPAKVLNFFDIAGSWDPSLAFVMGGALAVAAPGYRLVLRRRAPVLAPAFQMPATRRIDTRLVGGAAIFGLGWWIAGFCPGASLPALATGTGGAWVFVAALVAGLLIARLLPQEGRPAPAAKKELSP